ncbi:MAG TPA: NUDIX hydrolase [Terriglobales bacterium]|jgi:ADP-ribose pyrophosphatase|nr:NUDIX hydrolase [Terriglobales bacterium]
MAKQKKARVLSSKVVFRGPIFSVITDQVQEPSGIQARRDVVRHPGSIVILAVDDHGPEPRVLLERQYRHATGGVTWELPAGSMDPGESELAAAKRELLEETGYRARRWQRALKFFSSPGFLDETMSLYLARGLRPGPAQPEEDEVITVRFLRLSRALKLALRGTGDGKTIAGLLWLRDRLR